MTALCPGGGTSSVQPGVLDFMILVDGAATLIDCVKWKWLCPLLPVLGLVPLHTASFCTTDPPGFQAITDQEESDAILEWVSGAGAAARAKLLANVQTILWYQLCRCDGGTTPAVGAGPTPPAPIQLVPGSTGEYVCQNALTQGGNVVSSGSQITLVTYSVQPTWSSVDLFVYNDSNYGAPHNSITFHMKWFNASSVLLLDETFVVAPGTGQPCCVDFFIVGNVNKAGHQRFVPPDGATSVTVTAQAPGGTLDKAWARLIGYCGGAGPGSVASCCGSDLSLSAAITAINQTVTLLQRHLVPFAYVAGAVHSTLSGHGQFSVSGLLGVRVHLSTLPPSYGTEVGTPTTVFDVGWVSILTADGFIEERRLRSVDTVWTPRLMSDATIFGYSFSAGVVAQVTELEPEV